jgi:hypothetical protein
MFWHHFIVLILFLGCSNHARHPSQYDVREVDCLLAVNAFSQYAENIKHTLYERVQKIRAANHTFDPRVGTKIIVNTHRYEILNKLGESNSAVYLARSDNGKFFSIKMNKPEARPDNGVPSWMEQVWWYEKYKTRFYESKKFPVAHIHEVTAIDYSPIIVKEYIFGLNYNEISKNKSLFPNGEAQKIMNELFTVMSDFRNIEKEFKPWMEKMNYDPRRVLSNQSLEKTFNMMDEGDVRDDNFIYDVVRGQWVCIDP